jgi:hypothetical protein
MVGFKPLDKAGGGLSGLKNLNSGLKSFDFFQSLQTPLQLIFKCHVKLSPLTSLNGRNSTVDNIYKYNTESKTRIGVESHTCSSTSGGVCGKELGMIDVPTSGTVVATTALQPAHPQVGVQKCP